MKTLRGVALVASAVIITGWLASGLPFVTYARRPTPRPRPLPSEAAGVDAAAAGLQERTARLQSALVSPRPLPPAMRNPFQFRERVSRSVAPPAGERRPALTTAVVQAPPPDLRLIGVAEDVGTGAVVRTAVINGADQLFLVKVGDRVAGRFEVLKIGSDAVLLKDASSGNTVTLGLR